MKSVAVNVFGSDYTVRTDDPARVQAIAGLVDAKMKEIDSQFRQVTATRTAVLACMSLLDEHLDHSRIDNGDLSRRLGTLIEKLSSVL